MSIKNLNNQEAFEALKENSDSVYIDVRSIPEFEAEHPEGAYNIPIMHKGPSGMMPNAEFVQVIEKHFPKEKKLIIGCLRGGRSLQACMVLEQHGYTDLTNVLGGFGGSHDPMTGEVYEGWKDSGLPVSQDDHGKDYESLKE
ncbi:MAG: rhodanese-like domain-containing protein [Deltaproteobacteria bacterium]|nr:rhodanese-like domain-containing protein [Deltaproteobacteria bacterium]